MAEQTLRTETGGPELDELALTAGQAARQLGVAVTTLRSWHQRYGLGPTRHSPGRHRRYGPDDLARLATMRTLIGQGAAAAEAARIAQAQAQQLSGSRPESTGPGRATGSRVAEPDQGWVRAVGGLLDTALRMDAERVRRLVDRAFNEYGVLETWEWLVRPVLAEIGRRYVATGAFVEVEHLFSWTVSEALAVIERPGDGVPARVLLACADEEQHSLPLEALAAAAAQRGVRCRQLGPRVPTVALVAALQQTRPTLAVVWSHAQTTAGPAQLGALLDGDVRPPLLAVAGPGWAEPLPAGVVKLGCLADAVALAVAAAGNAAGGTADGTIRDSVGGAAGAADGTIRDSVGSAAADTAGDAG